jgi:hypothetical protein
VNGRLSHPVRIIAVAAARANLGQCMGFLLRRGIGSHNVSIVNKIAYFP